MLTVFCKIWEKRMQHILLALFLLALSVDGVYSCDDEFFPPLVKRMLLESEWDFSVLMGDEVPQEGEELNTLTNLTHATPVLPLPQYECFSMDTVLPERDGQLYSKCVVEPSASIQPVFSPEDLGAERAAIEWDSQYAPDLVDVYAVRSRATCYWSVQYNEKHPIAMRYIYKNCLYHTCIVGRESHVDYVTIAVSYPLFPLQDKAYTMVQHIRVLHQLSVGWAVRVKANKNEFRFECLENCKEGFEESDKAAVWKVSILNLRECGTLEYTQNVGVNPSTQEIAQGIKEVVYDPDTQQYIFQGGANSCSLSWDFRGDAFVLQCGGRSLELFSAPYAIDRCREAPCPLSLLMNNVLPSMAAFTFKSAVRRSRDRIRFLYCSKDGLFEWSVTHHASSGTTVVSKKKSGEKEAYGLSVNWYDACHNTDVIRCAGGAFRKKVGSVRIVHSGQDYYVYKGMQSGKILRSIAVEKPIYSYLIHDENAIGVRAVIAGAEHVVELRLGCEN